MTDRIWSHPPPNHTMHNKGEYPAWLWKTDLERSIEKAISHYQPRRVPLNKMVFYCSPRFLKGMERTARWQTRLEIAGLDPALWTGNWRKAKRLIRRSQRTY